MDPRYLYLKLKDAVENEEKDFQNIFDGWKDYYVGPLKAFVESKN